MSKPIRRYALLALAATAAVGLLCAIDFRLGALGALALVVSAFARVVLEVLK